MTKRDMEAIWRSKSIVSATRIVRWTTGGWTHVGRQSWLH